jgi:transcriptional regulator with XRE-family HTH domain
MQLLKIIREKATLSPQEMADLMGMAWGNYSRAEKESERLRFDFLYRAYVVANQKLSMTPAQFLELIQRDAEEIEVRREAKNKIVKIAESNKGKKR